MSLTPSFFIVGAPKAGTTAIHAFLELHPQVVMSIDKEPNFFSWQEIESQKLYYRKENIKNETDYRSIFPEKTGACIAGEASVSYLYYPQCAERIFRFNPDAKIIISLREPVARALSHYLMDFSLGLVKYTPEEIWNNGKGHPDTGLYFQQYFEISDYLPQIKQYLKVFPRNQIHFILHEELITNRDQVISEMCRFLSITSQVNQLEIEQKNVTLSGKNKLVSFLYANERFRKLMSVIISENNKTKIRNIFFSKATPPELAPNLKNSIRLRYQNSYPELSNITGLNLESWVPKNNTHH